MKTVIMLLALSVTAAIASQKLDTTLIIDTVVTYDTTMIVKAYKDTSILVSEDTIPTVTKKSKKVEVPKKSGTKTSEPTKKKNNKKEDKKK